jgi:hypothetical protein
MSTIKKFLEWDQTEYQIQWDNNPYVWEDVAVLIEVLDQIGAAGPVEAYKKLDKRKKKRLITLIANVRGEEFKEEKYIQEDIDVIIKDIEIVTKEVLGIEIKINK